MIVFNLLGGQIALDLGGDTGGDIGAVGGRAVIGGGGRSSLSQIAITEGSGSSSSSGGRSSLIVTSKRGGSSSSSSRGSSSSIGGSSTSSKITSIKGSSGRSSSGSQIYSKDGNLISIGKKIIYSGKSKKFSRQGEVETITVGRNEEERAKENFFSEGLLGTALRIIRRCYLIFVLNADPSQQSSSLRGRLHW